VGEAVFLGVFAGCTPAVGIHGWVAFLLATVCRRNRLYAWLGSRVSNFLIMPFIVIAEIECARYLRTGKTVELRRETVLEEAPTLLLDWTLGSILVGVVLGLVFGSLAYLWALRRQKREARASEAEKPSPEPRTPEP
jgi:uncharacterized protein (DUF2062 family)